MKKNKFIFLTIYYVSELNYLLILVSVKRFGGESEESRIYSKFDFLFYMK